jgi:DNA invertase Pin-like site-specific DNA recombinase
VSGTANEYRPLQERTGAGRVIAKANGVRLGRPRKLNTEQRALALRLLREGQSAGEVAKTLRVHGVTIYQLAAAEARD